MLPDKKILNGKNLQKTATKIVPNNSTKNLTKLYTSGNGASQTGNRTRNLLRRGRVLCTKGYLNGRS